MALLELNIKVTALGRVALSKGAQDNMSNQDKEKIAAELEQLAEGPSLTIDMQFAYRHAARIVRNAN